MPEPNVQVAPLWKLLPLRMTDVKVCPGAPELALTEVRTGAGGGPVVVIVNPLARVLVWLSGFVTVTLRAPARALAPMAMLAVSCVAELTVHEFTVIPEPNAQVAPL